MTEAPAQPGTQTPKFEFRIFLRKRPAASGGESLFLLRRRRSDGLWELPGGSIGWGQHFAVACQNCLLDDHGYSGTNQVIRLRPVQTMLLDGVTVEHTISLPFVIDAFGGEPELVSNDFDEIGWFTSHGFPGLLTRPTRMLLQELNNQP